MGSNNLLRWATAVSLVNTTNADMQASGQALAMASLTHLPYQQQRTTRLRQLRRAWKVMGGSPSSQVVQRREESNRKKGKSPLLPFQPPLHQQDSHLEQTPMTRQGCRRARERRRRKLLPVRRNKINETVDLWRQQLLQSRLWQLLLQ